MKNKPYPLYTAPLIHHLKDLVMYCAQTYKDRTAFQFIQDEKSCYNNQLLSIHA